MTGPRLTPLAERLPSAVPFVGPETQERDLGRVFDARIGANESVFGPSPKAVAAMQAALPELWMYGDPTMHALREALAAHHGVGLENIIIGEGIDGLLGVLTRLLVTEGVPVVTSDGAYPTFNYHIAGFGGRRVAVPYAGDHEDPDALTAAAAAEGAPLIYMANPDNPMGTWHDAATIQAMIERVPNGAVLCLDEAYAEFAPAEAIPPLDPTDPRVIRMRTFSKARGLAGLRVGYGIGHPELIRAFDKVRNHFGVGRVAQAGALAALSDAPWLAHVRAQVEAARARIGEIAAANGLTALPSAANFVAVDCGGRNDGGAVAKAVLDGLVARGVFVRMPFVAPMTRCIRVSAGRPADLDALAAALPEALAEARAAA
ncbi:MAG: pyridoxal phosphate-dependent aminotransferase [Pseudomonadota bacterium]